MAKAIGFSATQVAHIRPDVRARLLTMSDRTMSRLLSGEVRVKPGWARGNKRSGRIHRSDLLSFGGRLLFSKGKERGLWRYKVPNAKRMNPQNSKPTAIAVGFCFYATFTVASGDRAAGGLDLRLVK